MLVHSIAVIVVLLVLTLNSTFLTWQVGVVLGLCSLHVAAIAQRDPLLVLLEGSYLLASHSIAQSVYDYVLQHVVA
jgi:hypothetical protein